MRNPFKVDVAKGYQWWTCFYEPQARDHWGVLKLGPVSFTWGSLHAGHPHFEMTVLSRWLVRCCKGRTCGWLSVVHP